MNTARTRSPHGLSDSLAAKALRDLRVLLVDDEEDARELLATVLGSAGALVTQADSVRAAIKAFTEHDFGVLVSDIGMPFEDGYDLIRQLRTAGRSPQARAIPAVAVTAFAAPEDRHKSLAAGFQEHLTKPVDLSALIEVVASLAGLAEVAPAPGSTP